MVFGLRQTLAAASVACAGQSSRLVRSRSGQGDGDQNADRRPNQQVDGGKGGAGQGRCYQRLIACSLKPGPEPGP